jgi:PKD repeat protein
MFDYVEGQDNYGVVNTSYNNWVTSGCTLDPNMVNTVVGSDPGWVDGAWPFGDFHLAAGSQCIDAGNGSVANLPTKEYSHPCDWSARPTNGTIDIGAYEYTGGPVAPVAEFSGNPTQGPPPLTVYFTDLSSGSPTSWDWTFGDGGTSSAQDPSHDYTSVNSYTVSLTAHNAQGQDTETKIDYITVADQSCHVGAIDIVGKYKSTGPPSGRGYYAEATITVHDQDCQPLSGVAADITWSGCVSGTDSDVTDGNGQVVFTSPTSPAGGTFQCCVDDLTKSGYPYQSGDNHETCDSIQNP